MAVAANKDELSKAIKDNYARLKTELEGISPEIAGIQELEGHSKGTLMSIHNLVAYLVGWGELVLKWNQGKDDSMDVDFPETGFGWNQLGKLAQKFYGDYSDETYPSLLCRLDKVVGQVLSLVDQKTDEQLYGFPWYGKWTLGRMIQFNTSSPYANARARLRKWKREKKRI
ncbi:hypothetical protein DSL64_04345 [Dyadobacter luteus]|jgi:hypothetical protein|uniref:ClbS/DfsB family four-helix bundle protein n=1 Tax=Dyadobacter luteus TaxID=2259619 RepID=A0A3D8YG88_9BACT|nr:ClbS/DfsB family four-helix bundle protein [Dyadobacter luteus]REA63671.1 hypothetical protein DSL64_04345 [Dyadobacter luteus]